ncbi:MAG: flagellin, partial [Planctomycetes bacterium]|nr:flagellin [Planctomycetota bacterium]
MAIQSSGFLRPGAQGLTRNLAASIALKGVRSGSVDFQRVSERLATGQRINRASDDPSGLVIQQRLRAHIAGNDAAIRNNLITTNSLAVAQDGMAAILDRLNKLKSVALKSIGSGIADSDKTIFQDEAEQLLENIDQIVQNTNIGGNKILDGSGDFRIEETDDAFDQVRVKRARFPASGEIELELGISRLAERASIITNIDLGASEDLSSRFGPDILSIA